MKKILNALGIFGSTILTFILISLIFAYTVILNLKLIVSENGLGNTLKKIDVVEVLKTAENGTVWEDFSGLADTLNLTEEQFEQILNNDKVKEQIGNYFGEVISSALNEENALLTKEKIETLLNTAVDEYNKISNEKISETDKNEIINSFDEEMISNINEELGSINLIDTVAPEYVEYVKLADNIIYGNYMLIILVAIIVVIALIALFRFSCYKWMSYVNVSTMVSGILMLIVGLILYIIPLQNMEILLPLKKVISMNIFVTSAILFIISIALMISKKYIKKFIDKKKQNKFQEIMPEVKEESKELL